MPFKKYNSSVRYFRSNNFELDKLEKSQRSELRMISTAAFKLRSKFIKVDDSKAWRGENEASNLRMYETHFPGFCYLRDGKYRMKNMNVNKRTSASIESSENIKSLLFTDKELDIYKVLCLHLLGTHIQNRRHIQRKDGRYCIFIKSHNPGHKRLAAQSVSHRTISDKKIASTVKGEILPRYILDARIPDRNVISAETDSRIDDDAGKKKLPQVPIYVNNDIEAIVSSVIQALKTVNSSKLKELIALAGDQEKIKNMISREDIQQYMTELGESHLVSNSNAYDVIMTHPIFEKVSDSSSTEIVSQVLDIAPNSDMRNMLNIVRKTISRRCEELVIRNVLSSKKKVMQTGKGSIFRNTSKTSFLSCDTSTKTSNSGFTSGGLSSDYHMSRYLADSSEILKNEDAYQITASNETKINKNSNLSLQKGVKLQKKVESHSSGCVLQRASTQESSKPFQTLEDFQKGGKSTFPGCSPSKIDGKIKQLARIYESEISKCDLKSLNNSQRILLGLKIASMKNKPVNMHQFENKKQVDVVALITSIVRPNKFDPHTNILIKDDLERRKTKKTINKSGHYQVQGLGNLSRSILSNLRQDIATTENKKRVKEFIQAPL